MTDGREANAQNARAGLIIAAAALTTGIVGVAAFLPAARMWGFNHLAYYPVWVRLVALAAVAATFFPPVANYVYSVALRIPRFLHGRPRNQSTALIVVIAAIAMGVFWFGQASTHLLGDGQLIAKSYEVAATGNQTPVMRSAPAIIKLDPISKGATLFYYGASKVAREWFGKTATGGIRFSVCLVGALMVILILTVVRNGTGSRHADTWLLFLSLFSCAMQLFFGYIEMYPPLVLVLAVYVLASIMALHGRASTWLPAIIFFAAVAIHVQAILFLPSLIYLIWWRAARKQRESLERLGALVMTVATIVGAIVARFFTGLKDFFLPLVGNEETYGIVSPAHIADVFNELFMLLPIMPVVLALMWVSRSHAEPEPKKNTRPDLLSTASEWQFVLIGLFSCLVYLVGFHPAIGFARDWDLFMMTAVVLIPLTVLALNRYIRRASPDEAAIARFAAPAIVLSIVVSVAWIGVNASKAKTTTRFENILAYDVTHASYAYENLAVLHHDDGRFDDAVRVMEVCTEVSPNPRLQTRLAIYYGDAGQPEKGFALLYDILERRPEYEKARITLIEWLEKADQWSHIADVARAGIDHSPNDSRYFFYYGEALIRGGNPDEGIVWLRKALTMNPPKRALAHIQQRLKEYDSK